MVRAYRDIAKQFHFFNNPSTHADQTSRGYSVANPIESTDKQAEMSNRMLGRYVYTSYAQGRPVENPLFQAIERHLNSLAPSLEKQHIFALLRKSPQDGRDPAMIKAPNELASKDLAELGRLFHESYGGTLAVQDEPYWLQETFYDHDANAPQRKQFSQDFIQELRGLNDDTLSS